MPSVLSRPDAIEIRDHLGLFLLMRTGRGGGQPRPGWVRAQWPGAREKKKGATQLARELPSRSLGQLGLLTAFRIRVGLGNAGIRLKSVPSSREP